MARAGNVGSLSFTGGHAAPGRFRGEGFRFAAAIKEDLIWLAFVGVLNSIIGLYYYLTVLKYIYLYRSDDEDKPLPISRPYSIALTVLILGIIIVGTLFGPWFNISTVIASSIF